MLHADTIEERLERRDFPSVFQAWSPVEGTGEGELDAAARHDLVWSTLPAYGLQWTPRTDPGPGGIRYGGPGRALVLDPDSVERALEKREGLLARNPDMVLLTELRYRGAPPNFLSSDEDPWLLRDANGDTVLGWAEGRSLRLDFRIPAMREHLIERARAIMATGVVDGLMLDVWNELEGDYRDDGKGSFGDARVALVEGIRAAIGDKALLVINTNEFTAERSKASVNGLYLETYSLRTAQDWARYRETMEWAGPNLRSPAFVALETWRDAKGGADTDRNDPDDLRQMRATTALSLVASNGFTLFADPNSLPLSDHLHDWYDLWDVDLGRPAGPAIDLVGGAVRRAYDNGVAVYSPPGGTTRTVEFDVPVRSATTDKVATSHSLGAFDGDLFLFTGAGPGDGTDPPMDAEASVGEFAPPVRVGAGDRVLVSVPYASDAPAELVLSLQDTSNGWRTAGFARIAVPPGQSNADLVVDVAGDAVPGPAYAWTAWITAPGTDWSGRLDAVTVDSVSMVPAGSAFKDELGALAPVTQLRAGERFEVVVDYTASAARTLNVSLQDTATGWSTQAFARVDVPPGSGAEKLELEILADAPPGSRYTLGAYLTPRGGDWKTRLSDVRVDRLSVNAR